MPAPTVAFVDDYCAHYHAVIPNVRQFEQFTRLERGLVDETKRKSLPSLAQTTTADPASAALYGIRLGACHSRSRRLKPLWLVTAGATSRNDILPPGIPITSSPRPAGRW